MNIGISLNVGLNEVTSRVFKAKPLEGCEKDAKAMHQIALDQKFDPKLSKLLIGPDATLDNVVTAVKTAAANLQPGSLFLFTFAGHGTFKVIPSAATETDRHDESIVLADHLLIDNFWRNELWPRFSAGVRIVAIADCCHAGSALSGDVTPPSTNENEDVYARDGSAPTQAAAAVVEPVMRHIENNERLLELNEFPKLYEDQLAPTGKTINASRLFLSACLDDQKAADGPDNGAFTKALLGVWDNGKFTGNYNILIDRLKEVFKDTTQTPNITKFGDPDFSTSRPFEI